MRARGALLELALFVAAALLFALGFGLPEFTPPAFELGPRAPGDVRVMTWNVGGSGSGDEWGGPLRDEHVAHVAEVLRELDPDLCFLQEVRMGLQAEHLLTALGPGWQMEVSGSTGNRRLVAFAQRGSLRSLDFDDRSRRALTVRYEPNGGAPITAVGLHADAASAQRRNEDIGALATALVDRAGDTILLGDFNFDLDLGKRRDLFTDDEYLDVETYNFIATRFLDATLGTGSTAEPDRRLDYIFVRQPAFEVRTAGPIKNRRFGDMDHDPVLADLTR